jgi:hypothetical protein
MVFRCFREKFFCGLQGAFSCRDEVHDVFGETLVELYCHRGQVNDKPVVEYSVGFFVALAVADDSHGCASPSSKVSLTELNRLNLSNAKNT